MFESLAARSGYRTERASNFELWAWFFMRVSGVLLLFMVLFHLFWMHFVIGVEKITFEVVAQRWENPLWRLYDFFLLFFAFTHGTNGMRTILEDYIHAPGWRVTAKTLLFLLYVALLVMGAYVIVTFRA